MSFHCAFTILSDTKYLSVLRQWVLAAQKIAGHVAFPNRARTACTLALIEAVNNAIFHARGRGRERPIRVSIKIGNGLVVLEVSDTGRGIGRHARARPDEMVDHGRGLFLIHKLMTGVKSRMNGKYHSLRMTYRL